MTGHTALVRRGNLPILQLPCGGEHQGNQDYQRHRNICLVHGQQQGHLRQPICNGLIYDGGSRNRQQKPSGGLNWENPPGAGPWPVPAKNTKRRRISREGSHLPTETGGPLLNRYLILPDSYIALEASIVVSKFCKNRRNYSGLPLQIRLSFTCRHLT